MNKRINVILPTATVAVLDKVAAKGNRSTLIDRAIRHYVKTRSQQNLRERLKQEALANAERDLQMARVVSFGRRSMAARSGRKKKNSVPPPRRSI
jgi:metal-responsive CopG/Arc/MetJ family transcriptional regulator